MTLEEPNFLLFSSLRFDINLLQSSANTVMCKFACPFYMLPYHRDRMLQAAINFQWREAAERIDGNYGLQYLLGRLEAMIDIKSSPPLRVKTILHRNGDIEVVTSTVPHVPVANLFPSRIPIPVPKMEVSPLTGGALMLGSNETITTSPEQGDPQQLQPWIVKIDPKRTTTSPFTTYKTTHRDMYTEARRRVGIASMTEPCEVLMVNDTGNEIMEGSLTSVFFWRRGRWVTPPISSGGQAGTTRRWLLENGLCEEESVTSDSLTGGEECWISNGVRGLVWGKLQP